MIKPVFMTAVHCGETKSLSMNAWSRLIGVTEYFVKNRKYRGAETDQEIIDAAVESVKGISSLERLRKSMMHNMVMR